MNFSNYYFTEAQPTVVNPDAWRERRVNHLTPTGRKSRIKIKYLSPQQQERYKPNWLKTIELKRKQDAEAEGRNPDDIQIRVGGKGKKINTNNLGVGAPSGSDIVQDEFMLDFYFAVDHPKKFNIITQDSLTVATLEALETKELEDANKYITIVRNVPIEAVKSFLNEDEDWEDFDNMEDEDKFEKIKFDDAIWYKLDLYPYLERVRFELLSEVSNDENDETTNESLLQKLKYRSKL